MPSATRDRASGFSLAQSSNLLDVLLAAQRGDFSARMPADKTGLEGKICDAMNVVIEMNQRLSQELQRIGNAVGKEGKITQRAFLGDATGGWFDCVESVNGLIADLVQPSNEVSRVIGAVA
ncbi:MAG TPA: hypothetical protein VG345_01070, partial [Bryobacteraceae bacterium]|nr:hypothetical protein [Bryobacteraceae bacterium]